jgi:hypothetical protein
MPKMVLNRDSALHVGVTSLQFEKDKVTEIPDFMVQAAMALGAVAADDKQAKLVQEALKPKEKKKVPEGDNRYKQIVAAMEEMKALNNSEEFSAGGIPLQTAVESRCGFTLNNGEREKAWKFIIGG